MVHFYQNILGLKRVFTLRNEDGTPWLTYLQIAPKEFIELFNESYKGNREESDRGHHHVCLMVEDIFAAAKTLEEKGLLLTAGPKSYKHYFRIPYKEIYEYGKCGSLAFYVQDPEGNEIEIMQYTDVSMQVLYDQD
jgi:catechol 2,3-dioxygenase-like lactoylglutathione lyase family enzyme